MFACALEIYWNSNCLGAGRHIGTMMMAMMAMMTMAMMMAILMTMTMTTIDLARTEGGSSEQVERL